MLEHLELWLGAALLISEGLALIPMLKSNSILQMVIGVLKKFKKEDKKEEKK